MFRWARALIHRIEILNIFQIPNLEQKKKERIKEENVFSFSFQRKQKQQKITLSSKIKNEKKRRYVFMEV